MSESAVIAADPNLDVEIGRRVHQLMWDRRITQTAFGKRIGMDQSSVAKRLRGKMVWNASHLVQAAAVLDTTVAYLVGEEGGPGAGPRTTDYQGAVSHALSPVVSLDAYRTSRSEVAS